MVSALELMIRFIIMNSKRNARKNFVFAEPICLEHLFNTISENQETVIKVGAVPGNGKFQKAIRLENFNEILYGFLHGS